MRTWLYYSLLKHYLLHDQPLFDTVWIHHHILDEKGIKMSKSLGNVIDPKEIIQKFGAEPFRAWMALEGNLSRTDLSCSFARIEGAGKTLTKFWNVARFIHAFPQPETRPALTDLDEWILGELSHVVQTSRDGFENYDYFTAAQAMRSFLWDTFASHYLELAKNRAYNEGNTFTPSESAAAQYTLHYCLKTLLELFAPIIPIFTSIVYEEMYHADVHAQSYPTPLSPRAIPFTTSHIVELNSLVWKTKRDSGGNLKTPLSRATLPNHFQTIEKDLRATHTIQQIDYGPQTRVEL